MSLRIGVKGCELPICLASNPELSLPCWVTLGRLDNLSVPQFLHLETGARVLIYHTVFWWKMVKVCKGSTVTEYKWAIGNDKSTQVPSLMLTLLLETEHLCPSKFIFETYSPTWQYWEAEPLRGDEGMDKCPYKWWPSKFPHHFCQVRTQWGGGKYQ